MTLGICLFAIIIAIAIGWKFKINTGILAMGFAFLIGILLMGGRASTIIGYWPTNICFFLIAISLFFTYATSNGTMDLVGKKLLYLMNGNAKLIPWVFTVVSAVVGFLGAGPSTPAIVGPLAFSVGASAGIHPLLTAIVVGCANLIGGDNPFNGFGGIISKNLIAEAGYENAFSAAMYTWINSSIKQIVIIAIFYIVFKGYKAKRVEVEKPEPFNAVQGKTITLIGIAFFFMVVPPILVAWLPASPLLSTLNQIGQPQVVMTIAAILATILKLGDEKDIIRKLPMNSILMIAGVAMLLAVAREAGLVEAMAGVLSNNVSKFLVPGMMVLVAAFLSFFSSGTSVVCPLMYPLVPILSASMGLNPVMLFSCVYVGAMSSAVSPFSTGGSMIIAGCPDNSVKETLSQQLIIAAVVISLLSAVMASVGLFSLFHI